MKEIWRDIPGYEKFYQVSDLGKVRSVNRIVKYKDGRIYKYPSKILKTHTDPKGYPQVGFNVNGKKTNHRIHRLVAESFLGKPDEILMSVNHIDGIKTNNHLDNLEWVTYSENTKKGYETGLFDKAITTAKQRWIGNKMQSKPVEIIIKSSNNMLRFDSARDASKYIGKCQNYFTELLRRGGENKKYKVKQIPTQRRHG